MCRLEFLRELCRHSFRGEKGEECMAFQFRGSIALHGGNYLGAHGHRVGKILGRRWY